MKFFCFNDIDIEISDTETKTTEHYPADTKLTGECVGYGYEQCRKVPGAYNVAGRFDKPLEFWKTFYKVETMTEAIIKLFIDRQDDYKAHVLLFKKFGVKANTQSQLAEKILKASAVKVEEFKLKDRPQLPKRIGNIELSYGAGGIHGALENYTSDLPMMLLDVTSMYPSIMMEYCKPSSFDIELYKKLFDLRMKNKQLSYPLKIVLNSVYGSLRNKHSSFYEPHVADDICRKGQELMVDLLNRFVNYEIKIIQVNTDGVLVEMPKEWQPQDGHVEVFEQLVRGIGQQWQDNCGLSLTYKSYNKIIQKDVNNYIMPGKMKGKWLTGLDEPVIMKRALASELLGEASIEDTVLRCRDLSEFRFIPSISGGFDVLRLGDIEDKVLEVYAAKDDLFSNTIERRNKKTGKWNKYAGLPWACTFDVNKIDKFWYVKECEKRLWNYTGAT